MKPHPRLRKTIKWGGAMVTVLCAVSWTVAMRTWVSWSDPQGNAIWVNEGAVGCADSGNVFDPGWDGGWARWSCKWQPTWGNGHDGPSYHVKLPLWILVAIVGIPTAAAWRLDTLARRRARLNLCPKCNYDRTGLAAGAKCPECGSEGVSA